MDNLYLFFFKSILGFIVGGVIGLLFGLVQRMAKQKYKERQEHHKLSNAWSVIPGSVSRVTFLMVVLVLIQISSPELFDGNIKWVVSGGLVIGYAVLLLDDLRKGSTAARS
jgi:H+/Cl- antiporter ClcA